jgi:hypothetical protein
MFSPGTPISSTDKTDHQDIKVVSDLRQVGGFLRFPPLIKLTPTIERYQKKILEYVLVKQNIVKTLESLMERLNVLGLNYSVITCWNHKISHRELL